MIKPLHLSITTLPVILFIGIFLLLAVALFSISSCKEQQELQQERQNLERTRDSLWLQSRSLSSQEYDRQFLYLVLPVSEYDWSADVQNPPKSDHK